MLQSDSRTWNSVIQSHCIDSRHYEALSLFLSKFRTGFGFKPDHQVLSLLLKSSTILSKLNLGRTFHSYVVKTGFSEFLSVSKGLLNLYSKCGKIGDCKRLFERFIQCGDEDPVVWNIVLSGLASSGLDDVEAVKMFRAMCVHDESKPTSVTVAVVLTVCARLRDVFAGKNVQCYSVKSGLESQTLVGNALVSMYAKCGFVLGDAYDAFRDIPQKDVISWNAMIAGFAESKLVLGAFDIFTEMLKEKTEPNYATIVNILPLCGFLDKNVATRIGKQMHSFVLQRTELVENVSVLNALLSFYLRIGHIQKAEVLFWNMRSRDLVSWNAIIAGYAGNDDWNKALDIFTELVRSGTPALDYITLVSVLPACANISALEEGKEIHGYVVKRSTLCENTAVGNALISFYAKCDDIGAAHKMFYMTDKDLVSWNTMLNILSEAKYATHVFTLFHDMVEEGLRPDSVTMLSVLQCCASASCLRKVKESHCYSIKFGLLSSHAEPTLVNSIIDGYAKCGSTKCAYLIFQNYTGKLNVVSCNSLISGYATSGLYQDAFGIFEKMSETDITTWTLMIRVYAENDLPNEALNLFINLQARGLKPDAVTVMSILPICSKMASVHQLKQCHGYVLRSCFHDLHLMGALLDLYSKCGSLHSAEKLFHSNPEMDLVMFTAMVGGYAMHGMGEEAVRVFYEMLDLGIKPDPVIITSVLSACSHSGQVDEGWKIFDSIRKVHAMKPTMEHYSCVVDLLARTGRVQDAYSFTTSMPVEPAANIWGTLLGACKTYNEVELGRLVADRLFDIEAGNIGNYVVMSNLYAAGARWDKVVEMRKLMRSRDLKKPAGCSWIEVQGTKNEFIASDYSHPKRCVIYWLLCTLDQHIKDSLQT
uniref:Pentatricopeptide repeat-containing protein n=1 Tax=Kalanchoe fedtschenkoi TaxID=63787 RepID=A0A7N0ZQW3_KALFE